MSVTAPGVARFALDGEDLGRLLDARTLSILERRRAVPAIRRRGWLIRRALLAADVIGLAIAFAIAELGFAHAAGLGIRFEVLLFVLTLPGWVLVTKLYGLYDRDEERTDHSTADDFSGVFHIVTVGSWTFYGGAALTGLAHPTLPKVAAFWGFAILLITGARAIARALCRGHIAYLQNTIIVGAGDVGQLVARKFASHPEYGINVVGFVDGSPRERRHDLGHLAVLGEPCRLPELVDLLDVERVVIAFSNEPHEATLELVRQLKDADVQIDVVPRLFEVVGPRVSIHTVEGVPLVGLPPMNLSRSSHLLKRIVDLAITVPALIVLSPLFIVAAAAIKLDSPGPVFFRQLRMGAGNKTFRIFKLRTMVANAEQMKQDVAHLNRHALNGGDSRMFKVPDDPRVTRVGRQLRRYFLDELPQLLNVLVGEMSLVGPRPLILDEHQHVDDWAQKRLGLKPGITGLWQVLGAGTISFEEMVKLDYLYVTSWSLRFDLKLLAQTLPVAFRGGGSSH